MTTLAFRLSQIHALRKAIGYLQGKIKEHEEAVTDEIISKLNRSRNAIDHVEADNVLLSWNLNCDVSPTGHCVYDLEKGLASNKCLYCHSTFPPIEHVDLVM